MIILVNLKLSFEKNIQQKFNCFKIAELTYIIIDMAYCRSVITPEDVSKVRPKCHVPVLTAPPLDELIPLILNAPHDFINTQFTDEVLRARKEKHMEKKARKYYAEIVFQVNLYKNLSQNHFVNFRPLSI